MPKLPRISEAEAVRALGRLGFQQARQRGSHVVLRKRRPEGDVVCVVPLHRELALGTLRGILKQGKVSLEEFLKQL